MTSVTCAVSVASVQIVVCECAGGGWTVQGVVVSERESRERWPEWNVAFDHRRMELW